MSKEHEVREMAKLSILSNRLNDIQLKNLKMYALIFFEGVSEAELSYDFSISKPMVDIKSEAKMEEEDVKMDIKYEFQRPSQSSFVQYNLTIGDAPIEHLEKRFHALEMAIRNLFWKEVKVRVLFNDKQVYESSDV